MKVKLGKNASIFHDPSVGVTILKGKVATLTNTQATSPKVLKAIRSGHLVKVNGDEDIPKKVVVEEPQKPVDQKDLVNQFEALMKEGKSNKELTNAFNKAELTTLAEYYGIEVEDSDTKASIMEAILETIEEEKEDEQGQ